jgi:AcrR family transcriptional regulator
VDRRAQILDAAESQFARFGFGATRLQRIADQVGIRVASLYNHFASKDELYAAVLERALEPVHAMLDDSLGSGEIDDPASGLMVAFADLYAAHPAIVHLFQHEMLVGDEGMHPLMRGWLTKLSEAGRAHLERLYVGPDRWAEDEIPLLQIAMFNAVCGYFTAAPLHLLLTGEEVGSTRALARQREFLRKVEQALMGFRATRPRVTSDDNGER